MKLLAILVSALFATTAFAKESQITGAEARAMMETLAASGFAVSNIDDEWSNGKPLEIKTGIINCHYTAAYFPDEWMSSATCFTKASARSRSQTELRNPLALAKTIQKYAFADAGAGNRWLIVDSIACSLKYEDKVYSCTITAQD